MKNNNTLSKKLKRNHVTFRKLTGITPEIFDEILEELKIVYKQQKKKSSKAEIRNYGGGNKHKLKLEDRLLLTLIYYRTYITYAFLSFIFNIDESTVGRNIKPIEKSLAGIFKIPERKIDLTEDEVSKLFIDGTEQIIERPTKKQRKYYSGKKKKHTIKHEVTVVCKKNTKKQKLRIASVSKSFTGKTHDKKIYTTNRKTIPPDVEQIGDTAYIGKDVNITVPFKSSKLNKLTKEQKLSNRKLSSKRIVVEHVIGKMKIYQILSQRFRNKKNTHTLVFKNIAGLTNRVFA